MRKWARNTGRAALVAAGAVAVGAAFGSGAVASADTTSGNFGALNGNQARIPISIPVEASGNAVAGLGVAQAQSMGGASVENARHGGGDMQTSGNFGVGNGNQINAPISIPIDVCGNAVAIAGISKAQCKGGASVSSGGSDGGYDSGYRTTTGWADHGGGSGGGSGGPNMQTSSNFGLLNGNQVYAPISIPVNVCGNAVAVLGAAQAQCKGGASVERSAAEVPNMQTSSNFGLLNGNQVYAPIKIPVNVCGNAVAVLGLAQAQCKGGASVGDGHEMPPTLRTPPKHKVYKPSKHRPAAGHKKLPSTLRASNSRMARPSSGYRSADGLPAVQDFLDSLKRSASVPGVDVKPGQIGPKLPMDEGAPVKVGSPVLS